MNSDNAAVSAKHQVAVRSKYSGLFSSRLGGALCVVVLMTFGALPALSEAVSLIVDVQIVGKGYRVSKLTGTNVTNSKNETIGTLDDIIISKDRIMYAVLQIGGFLGVGSHFIAVPYQSLVLNDDGSKITLPNVTRKQLEQLPEFRYLVG